MSTQDPSSSSPSKGTKRRRDEEEAAAADDAETAASESLEQSLTFSDTLVALRMMRAQFPHIDKVSIRPFVLRSQLYSSVVDRTQVDRELESLRRTKVLRIFKLNTGQDDHAIMFLDDYLNQIERAVKRMEEKNVHDLEVFEWFKIHVIDTRLEPNISHQDLCSLLSLGGKVKDNQISVLINGGVIIRQLIDPSMYWFAIPNVGSMLKGLSQAKDSESYMSQQKSCDNVSVSSCRSCVTFSLFPAFLALLY
ncbi:uncharacterized protein LOC115757451 isoform X3 [Rhodamnia argentea]|uniref:Uncharacterized protein LOC115757451 isoform X3 n=1 Tax=Rhodamnia argentea TaxID=178133 RepID=A0ABM3HLP6_9MYRT|nr:uncharacterized protein LOC115757451 isoform X3 [Rhodamnia argentea]